MTDPTDDASQLPRIVSIGDPVLRRRAAPVDPGVIVTSSFQRLIEQLRMTMVAAPGVGLAAPQVGLGIQLAVLEDVPAYWAGLDPSALAERERTALPFTVLVNPLVQPLEAEGAMTFYEGCLSVPGYAGAVERARSVRVTAFGADGQPFSAVYTGWSARIVQHEVDHLEGRVYLDRVLTRSIGTTENLLRWRDLAISDLAEELGFELSPRQREQS